MSIIVNNISYVHPDRETLFEGISFSLADGEKASLIGDNGAGKSTLLKILSGELRPASGEAALSDTPYIVPQHFGQYDSMTVAEAMGVAEKITALDAILGGDASEAMFAALDDDWGIRERVAAVLEGWGLGWLSPDGRMSELSGGEKTRVFLAGMEIHSPSVIIMDEPTNHLDVAARERLYRVVRSSPATILIVSHDRELLSIPDVTLELSSKGLARYGGNYDFYRELRDADAEALREKLDDKEKAIRAAQRKARHAIEQKERSDARAPAKHIKARTLPGKIDKMRGSAQESMARLKERHADKIEGIKGELEALKGNASVPNDVKIALRNSGLHEGKTLIVAEGVNFSYSGGKPLWGEPLDLRIESGERIAIRGGNGKGKTTMLKLLSGELQPTAGVIRCAEVSVLYVDQEYSMIRGELTVLQQLELYNRRKLPDHLLKQELHRFLFPVATWDKPCAFLSGGERMRLMLCCLLVADEAPDLFVLDEPANNLDIRSMEILTSALRGYNGTLLVISHDDHFLADIGIGRIIEL